MTTCGEPPRSDLLQIMSEDGPTAAPKLSSITRSPAPDGAAGRRVDAPPARDGCLSAATYLTDTSPPTAIELRGHAHVAFGARGAAAKAEPVKGTCPGGPVSPQHGRSDREAMVPLATDGDPLLGQQRARRRRRARRLDRADRFLHSW